VTRTSSNMSTSSCLLTSCASELEGLRNVPLHDGVAFPPSCQRALRQIPGNTHCADCGNPNPDWASTSYGILLCVQCSGKHRSYGVATSRVRSISMDAWSHSQILSLLEGGNQQLQAFFQRHHLHTKSNKYHTKAAQFYRTQLQRHVHRLANQGVYPGRAVSRNRSTSSTSSSSAISVR